ncbi:HNH endonuclease [Mycolicibacterium rhodesiae JS60]|nr:HNH endonuclease [Mycolicibacterium rhodesiae JS60]
MTLKPCVVCGTPATGSRCHDHRLKNNRTARRSHGQAAHDPRWRALSAEARRQQPWCDDCDSSSDLTADHIIPKSVAPELVHAIENVAVRCRSCNSLRGNTGFTAADVRRVLAALTATYRRRPTRAGRERIAAAERALLTRGEAPSEPLTSRDAKAQGALHTPGGYV